MNCINNLNRTPIPSDVFMASVRLYYRMGKNDYYETLFRKDEAFLSQRLAQAEAYSFFKCFFAQDNKIPESRLRTLQLDSSVAKTKGEVLYKNILQIFQTIHNKEAQKFHLNVTEIVDLARILYGGYLSSEKIQYQKIERHRHSLVSTELTSKRELLEEMIAKVEEHKKQKSVETIYLYLNFMIDFLHMDLFRFDDPTPLGMIIFYVMVMQDGVLATRYVSFFESLLVHIEEFKGLLEKTRFGWSEGFSELMPLHRFILKHYHDLYGLLAERARDYDYESNLEISKSDYIENTIDKLPEVFSKEDIRLRHPLISDSTINRTLQRLQEENKIRPLGKGRSAKWIKLYKKERKVRVQEQLNLDFGE